MFGYNNNKFEGNNVDVIGQMTDDFVLGDDVLFDSNVDTFNTSKLSYSTGTYQLSNNDKELRVLTVPLRVTMNSAILSKRVGTENIVIYAVLKNPNAGSSNLSMQTDSSFNTPVDGGKSILTLMTLHATNDYFYLSSANDHVLSLIISKKVHPNVMSNYRGMQYWKNTKDTGYRLLPYIIGNAFFHQNSTTDRYVKVYRGITKFLGTTENIKPIVIGLRAKTLNLDLQKIEKYCNSSQAARISYDGANPYLEDLTVKLNRQNGGTHYIKMYNALKKLTIVPDGLNNALTDGVELNIGNATRLTIDYVRFQSEYIHFLNLIFHTAAITVAETISLTSTLIGQLKVSDDRGYINYATANFKNQILSTIYLTSHYSTQSLKTLVGKTYAFKVERLSADMGTEVELFDGTEELTGNVFYFEYFRFSKLPKKITIVPHPIGQYASGGVQAVPGLVWTGVKSGFYVLGQIPAGVNVKLPEITFNDTKNYYALRILHYQATSANLGKLDLPDGNIITLPATMTSAFAITFSLAFANYSTSGGTPAVNYTLNQLFAKFPDLSAFINNDIYSNNYKNTFYYQEQALLDGTIEFPSNMGNFQCIHFLSAVTLAQYDVSSVRTFNSLTKTEYLILDHSSSIQQKVKYVFNNTIQGIKHLEINHVQFIDLTKLKTLDLTITSTADFSNINQYVYYDYSRYSYVEWVIIAKYIKVETPTSYVDWKTTAKRVTLRGYQKLPLGTAFIAVNITLQLNYAAYCTLLSMESIYENYNRFKPNPNDPTMNTSAYAKTLNCGLYGYSAQLTASKPDAYVLKGSDGLNHDIPYIHNTDFATISANSYSTKLVDKLSGANTRKVSIQVNDLQGNPIEGMLVRLVNYMSSTHADSNLYTTNSTRYHMMADGWANNSYSDNGDYSAVRFSTNESGLCEIKYLAPVKYYYEVFDKYTIERVHAGVLDCSTGDASITLSKDTVNSKKVRIYLSLTHGGYTNYVKPGAWSTYSNYWLIDGIASTLLKESISDDTECWVECVLPYGTHTIHTPILDAKTGSDGSVIVKFQEKFNVTIDANTPSSITINFDYSASTIVNTTLGYTNLATLATAGSIVYSSTDIGIDLPGAYVSNAQYKYFSDKTYLVKYATSSLFSRVTPITVLVSDEGTVITRTGLWPQLNKTSPYYVYKYTVLVDNAEKTLASIDSNTNREILMVIRDFYGDGVDYYFYGAVPSTPYSNSVNKSVEMIITAPVAHMHLVNELRYVLVNQQNADGSLKYRWSISN